MEVQQLRQSDILIPDTPYLDCVRRTLGVITLDPCSSERAQTAVSAQTWYRADQALAALAEPWAGRVFLHPHPKGRMGRLQVQKLLRDYLHERVEQAIILSQRTDLIRLEPLLLNFPWFLHWKRLRHWRFDEALSTLKAMTPSHNLVTVYLPPRDGAFFDEAAVERFTAQFSSMGRILLCEDLDERWERQALEATSRWHVKPVLLSSRLSRSEDPPPVG